MGPGPKDGGGRMKNGEPTIKDYLEIISRGKGAIILGTAITTLVAGLVVLILPDIYRASARVYIHNPKVKTMMASSGVAVMAEKNRLDQQFMTSFGDYEVSVLCFQVDGCDGFGFLSSEFVWEFYGTVCFEW